MLERLFGSTTRLKLLKTFLFQPERRFTLDELIKTFKLKPDSVKRELDNLSVFGIISSGLDSEANLQADLEAVETDFDTPAEKPKKIKDIKYFQLNSSFVLVEDLKTLIARGQILYERDFVNKLLTTGKIKYLMLSGFFVNRTDAPVDLLVVGRINKVKLVKIIKEFEKELGREVNFTHFEPQEFLYRKSLADVFIYELLEGPNLVVIDEFLM